MINPKACSLCRILLQRRFVHNATRSTPFRMAIIGSGPAGFYAASKVMSRLDDAVIDMYELLPTPFGLVRYGVAPDHPEVKNCEEKFSKVALSPRFNFVGNVRIGIDLSLKALRPHYDAILFSYGASEDRTLDIPGEDWLKGIYSARAFVGWYNGLPQYADLAPDLSGSEAVVIGHGNVALDVARILLTNVDALKHTDMAEHALATLSKSKIKHVRVIGRRGPLQAPFTIKEVRELLNLPDVEFVPIPNEYFPPDTSTLLRPKKRMIDLLRSHPQKTGSKSLSLSFLLSPERFLARKSDASHVGKARFGRNLLLSDDDSDVATSSTNPAAKIVPTGETEVVNADVVFRSVGYRSVALPDMSVLGVAFDRRRGIIPNDGFGRVVKHEDNNTVAVPGLYCAGWVKRGPTGVIASTMEDAFHTAEAIVEDWKAGAAFLNGRDSACTGWVEVQRRAMMRGLKFISWKNWCRIDEVERQRGAEKGKIREKICRLEDIHRILEN